ncbi:MAG: hypothetical protein RIQ72_18 [Candidatus Parcubacteria bacterium]|jgi:signal transduction histidine kinase
MKKHISILILSIAGLLFSGFLSAVKFFSNTCALGETCPIFLGLPACYFGFAMYLALAILSVFFVTRKSARIRMALIAVSGLGIFFAGYFTGKELPKLFAEGIGSFVLGLPTCAWGLLFYVAIFVLTVGTSAPMSTPTSVAASVPPATLKETSAAIETEKRQ